MRDVVDLHTHTIASGHAYNTIYEMAESAAEKGVELLGISDHGPAMEGTTSRHYFHARRHVPRTTKGIQVLFGIEFNILDYSGAVDLKDESSAPLDYAIASLHVGCIRPGTMLENTEAYLGAMKHPKVLILGHPDDGAYNVDFEKIAQAAAEQNVLIEMNEASVCPGSFRLNAAENAYHLLKACKKHDVRLILSSDAHSEAEILQHQNAWKLVEEIKYPDALIANISAERMLSWLHEKVK